MDRYGRTFTFTLHFNVFQVYAWISHV
jgi:hypothetical protein